MCSTVMMSSCSEGVEGPKEDGGQKVTPVGQQTLVILDTDIGSSTDDLFALEMLHRYHDEGRCRLLGVVVDREGEDYAACTDVMNTYFGHGDLPIGLERDGIKNPRVFTDYRNLRNLNDNGRPLFAHTIEDYSALPDGWKLYRQLLASQPDGPSARVEARRFVSTHRRRAGQEEGQSPLPHGGCLHILRGA